jgi:hypothetical protein
MRRSARTATRLGAYVASAALAVSGSLLAVTAADAVAHDPIGRDQGATWLAGQLKAGLMHYPDTGFGAYDDYGLSIDTAFALKSVGGHDQEVASVTTAIANNLNKYITGEAFGDTGSSYAGAVAKAAVLAQETGEDPSNFGGVNLVTSLEARVSSTAPIAGRLEDASTYGDNANTLGQAFASRSLDTARSSKASDVTNFLLRQQCSSGYFRLAFTADKTAANQSCLDGTDAPDTDATAIAVLQLKSQSGNSRVSTAIDSAKAWLVGQQKSDGSFGGGTSTEDSNANSTGLAALALGDTEASEKAAQWLRARQATYYDGCDKLATQRGAIAYEDTALANGRSNGITTGSTDQWRRTSAQAVPALAYLPVDTTPSAPVLDDRGGYLKAGTRHVVTASGVASGDQLCLSGTGAAVQGTATGPTWRGTVILPAGTATRVYTVRDADGHADTQAVKVLGQVNLSVLRSTYKVKRSRAVTATVRRLAPGEWSRILYKGKLVRSGKASSTGTFSARFKVGRATGRQTIVGYGQFTDIRRGTAVVRVVR